jgi:4-hydroxy-tetrahydrodipicolinate reductase
MGRALLRAAPEFSGLTVVAAVVSGTSSAVGQDAGEMAGVTANGVKLTSDLEGALALADVAIDFSHAQATRTNLTACRRAGKALLLGTTGFSVDLAGELDAASREIPLLVAPNTSVGVTLLIELVREAARALPGAAFDIEIIEAHHRMKKDAPSGTALALGRAAAEGRGQELGEVAGRSGGAHAAGAGAGATTGRAISQAAGDGTPRAAGAAMARDGVAAASAHGGASAGRGVAGTAGLDEPHVSGQIGFACVRGGDIVGDHTVLFAGTGERLTLSHQATDRAIFARGALQAAAWLAPRPAGRYFMRDLVTYKSGS